MHQQRPDRQRAAQIVIDAGGRIVGRTRMQKIAFLFELSGLGEGFRFEYKHYGPYSEELSDAVRSAAIFNLVEVQEHETSWGGWYSTYSALGEKCAPLCQERAELATEASKIDAIALELAATAAYLSAIERYEDPWAETERRKPEKAGHGRLEKAKAAYQNFLKIKTPNPLPKIV